MNFNPELNIGTIVIALTFVASMGGFYYGTRSDLKTLQDAMLGVKEDLKLLNKVVMDVALSNQRQDNFEKRTDDRFRHMEDDLREMKHGKGFISS